MALACAPTIANAQSRVTVVQIWQNFVASRAAATGCNALDRKSDKQFLKNQATLANRALQSVEQKSPTTPAIQIANRMVAAHKAIGERVNAEITLKGCASPNIQQLLKMYRMHAAMKL